MEKHAQQEVWLRGPVEGVPALLQPAAHALLQSMEEIIKYTAALDDEIIWQEPAGNASVAFHLQHIAGFLDRLFTYSEGRQLSADQLAYLATEGKREDDLHLSILIERLQVRMNQCIDVLKATSPDSLSAERLVGRAQLPSTVIGLLFHAAEHCSRHTGQILVTSRLLKSNY